ncbi:MAG: leucine-rich repeat domain-containing protein [Clostridia bacterium]|nr:leucine-rich repeat domain-containing protein [Clostridia bacterium]
MYYGTPVTEIKDHAFDDCKYLRYVSIPDTIETIGANPFRYSKDISKIKLSKNHPYIAYLDGALYVKAEKRLVTYFRNDKRRSFVIPQGIRIIGDDAFYEAKLWDNVSIPDSVTTIGERAFSYSTIHEANIPASVASIGEQAFYRCRSLETVKLSKGLKTIGNSAFEDCGFLSKISLPEGVTSIGDYAFAYCDSLRRINIPNSVTEIGANPFKCSDKLTLNIASNHPALSLSGNVLYSKADHRLVALVGNASSVKIAKDTEIIGADAFWFKPLKSVSIPDTVKAIGDSAFGCTNLVNIKIPANVAVIGPFAFSGNDELKTAELQSGLEEIGRGAFSSCPKLKSITIPETVTKLGDFAFWQDSALEKIEIKGNIPEIGEETFKSCSFESIDLPDSVESIGDRAFLWNKKLKNVKLPANLKSIGSEAFSGCAALETLEIPASVTEIGRNAFKDCNLLRVETESDYVRWYCEKNGIALAGDGTLDWLR